TMFAIHNIQDSSVTVSFKNNIASKLFNYDNARPFRIDSTAGEVAIEYNALHNFNTNRAGDFNVDSLLDYPNVTISNIYTFNPQFKDTNGYFMLPDTSSLLIAGSDGGPIGDPRWIPQVGVTIREITERVVEGSDVQLIADVVLSEGSDLTVTWSVTNNYDGTTGTATINSSTGLLSALTPGKVLVTATSNHNPAISGTLVVTIDELVLVTSITLSAVDASGDPSTSITNKGGFLTITAVIAPGNADDKSIEWSVSDTNLATINEKTATTAELIAKLSGTVYAIASAKDGSGIKDSIEITISGQTPVESVTVSSTGGVTEITTKGGTLQMIATVLPENADIKEVTWSVDDESVATISSTGLLTAVADGEVTVTARATDGTFKSGTMDITISGQTVGILSATNAEIMVVPNPATDFITIKTNEESEVTIYNVLGEIELIKLIDPNGTINVSYLKSGLYFVNVKIGDEVKTARLIIK
ncbi:MAG: Ig-like domain-containing protein, partial [Bacteroidales bacterium]|nr:Ig-like domain-containing protein [Bacteroidales bacterium]